MSGYRADPAELAVAERHLRHTADALAEAALDRALPAHAGPPRLAAALTAFTEDAAAALDGTRSALSAAAAALAGTGSAYVEAEEDAADTLRGLRP
ncbi:hypothetical protein [Actinokineospora bangkokensis]|uniref:ESX-1 secretion-associated protein n=1 Tax=Actinokineospora bangkokensis TaxID=1193682 RepID=A0A1Q9LFK7_9PSEU|nr:hypothetical protein [Actinokineospora bangkokensis]OLR90816.1 hypothetical protein BJP25_30060 [Actinokineospora bangkokensis]